MPSQRVPADVAESLFSGAATVGDPGTTNTIAFNLKGYAECPLTVVATVGTETRVLDTLTMSNYPVGQLLNVYLQTTAGGAVRITGSQDGSITLTSVGDFAVFQVSPTSTSARAWRLVSSPAGILAARGLNKVTVTSNTSGDASPSVAELRAGVYELSTGTTATLTLPTGAVMLAGISGLTTGDSFDCLINNNNSGTCTLAAGASGSTLEGSIATIATTVCRLVRFVITNGSTGAYTAYVVV